MIEENMLRGSLTSTQEAKGSLGFKGDRGYSAYEIAVQNGYEGTEQEWIDHFGLDLTNYLKTSDIIDNTWQGGTKKPLSAEAGKSLNTYIAEVQSEEIAIDEKVGDLNNLTTTDKTSVVDAINEVFSDNDVKGDKYEYTLPYKSGTITASSWQYLATDTLTDTLPKGRYLLLYRVTGGGTSSTTSVLTFEPTIDNNGSSTQRLSIPITSSGTTTGQIWRVADFTTDAAHTLNIRGWGTTTYTINTDVIVTIYRLK